ncbi:TonB-dependent receptor [Dyella sp.]|uniref:TonB-dependent receptor n=1 Tax=Dyella sp. TaxID=1869338 RepID=UPI002D789122|nr:TonB-dependent receptor [Dyella sp.]HET7332112.1 TonB-dependent receptor [Dyella sp.]
MTLHRSAMYVALAAVLAASPALALAQDATPQATTDKGNGSSKQKVQNLDTIQVSATKRETPLQQTPVAVTAITADALDKERVMTVQDITKLVPGLQGTTEGDHGVTTLTMRGIGNDSAKTEYADPEVALFIDGVYSPRAESATSLLMDIDSVQVLRGPQGTLWGRNSTAGAIDFETVKPDPNGGFNGNAQMSLGSYSQSGQKAAVNLPISSTFALRVAVAHEQHDGYVNFQNPGSELPSVAQQQAAYLASGGSAATFQPINQALYVTGGDNYSAQNQTAARISALWQPTDSFKWNLSYEYFLDRGTPSMNLMQNPRPGQAFWSVLTDVAPYLHRTSKTVRSRMDWQINPDIAFTYIAGYNRFSGSANFDQDDGAILPTSFTTGGVYQEDRTNYSNYSSYSHEFDLKSSGQHTVDWILGLYYASEDNNIRFDIPIMNGTQQGTVSWQGSFIQPKETVESEAIFGQAVWHVTDAFNLTAGARFSDDTRKNEGGINWGWAYDPTVPQVPIAANANPPDVGFTVGQYNDGRYHKTKVTWLGRADYLFSKNAMVYASVSTGYKSGGTQDGGALYKPESLTNYEVGAKFTFFDGHMTWNSAAYYEDFKNFQLSAPIVYPNGNHGLGFSNVGGSTKVAGFESELALQDHDDRANLVLSVIPKKTLGTLIYAGSNDYAGLPACPPASNLQSCMNITGHTLPHAPDASLTAIYEHDFHLPDGSRLTPRVSAQYQTMQWLSPFNLGAGDQQKAYLRSDFSLRYTEPQDRWYINAYVQNLSNGKVRTNAGRFVDPNGNFVYVSQYLPPRTYGVEVGVWF